MFQKLNLLKYNKTETYSWVMATPQIEGQAGGRRWEAHGRMTSVMQRNHAQGAQATTRYYLDGGGQLRPCQGLSVGNPLPGPPLKPSFTVLWEPPKHLHPEMWGLPSVPFPAFSLSEFMMP